MAKIIKAGDYISVVYSDGYVSTQPEREDGQLFVQAFLYQDDEEELEKLFPRKRENRRPKTDSLEHYKKLYEKKKGG